MWLVWAVAYLMAGFGFVAKDQAELVHNRLSYVSTSKGRRIVHLAWPIVSILILLTFERSSELRYQYIGSQFLPTWFMFVAIGAIGTLVISWIFD